MKRFIRTNLFLVCLLLATFVARSQSPTAGALGFNVFLENGATMTNNETEGPMAMGGDLTISGSYQVATNYTGSYTVSGAKIGLLIGGRVNYNGGSSFAVNKNTYVKIGNATGSNVWYTDNNNAYSPIRLTPGTDYNGSPRINLSVSANDAGNLGSGGVSATHNPVFQSGLIDFTAAFNTMRSTATCMGALTDNANITNSGGTPIPHSGFPAYAQVKLNLHSGMNVLNLNGSDLNNISDFIYNNSPSAGQYLVVNVNAPGTFNWSVCNSSGSFNGLTGCAYIIYNFYNTTTLNIQGGGAIEGTLYAPYANVVKTANAANVEGQIIAKSYTHNGGENHYAVFAPAVCTSSPTVAAFTTNTSAQCLNGNSYVFTNGSTGSSLTYSWNFGDATSSTATSPTHVYSAAGTYTVTLTTTGTAGTNATSAVVTVNAMPTVSAGSGVAICNGSSTTLSASGGSSYVWTPATALSCTDCASPVANPSATTTYTVTGTNAAGCSATASVTVTINTAPASITGAGTVCMSNPVTLTNSVTGGTWSSSNTSIATAGSATGTVTGVANGTAVITYMLAGGCYTTKTITVSPTPATPGGPQQLCMGAGGTTFTDAMTSGTWASSNSSIATVGSASGLVAGVALGTATISYIMASGCYAVIPVTVNPMPTAITGAGSLCSGQTLQLASTTAGGSWSTSSSSVALIGSATGLVTGSNGGTSTISYTIQPGSCAVAAVVTVGALPAFITGNTTVCAGSSSTLVDGSTGGTWYSSNTAIATVGATSGVVTGVSAGTATISYTLGTGCARVVTVTITAQPNVSTSANVAICANGSTVITASGASSYSWSAASGLSCTNCASPTATPATTTTYTVTGTGGGCTNTATVTVSVNALPTISAGANVAICTGGSTTLTATGGASYTWTAASSLSCTSCSSPIATPATTTTYTVTGKNGNNCTNTATVTVSVNSAPASITGTANVCEGVATTLSCGTTGGTWSSTNTTVASVVPGTGVVSGLASGTSVISYIVSSGCYATRVVTVNPALSASAAAVNVLCNGNTNGSVNLTVSGGTPSFTYSWSNGAATQNVSGLAAGTYSVQVTDAKGCIATASKTITAPAALTASGTATNVSCNGGSNGAITLSVSGGTAAYTYNWSNGAATQNVADLAAGTYSVAITDANGCTAAVIKTITSPAVLTASGTATNASCNGGNNGAITLSVSGGTAAYTYNWSNGATIQNISGLAAGTYSVAVTDANGCTAAVTKTVTAPDALTASAVTTNVGCFAGHTGAIDLTINGGSTPYTYSWSNGAHTEDISGVTSGTYNVTITDNRGCTATLSKTITQPVIMSFTTSSANVLCNGGNTGTMSIAVTGGVSPYTYLWSTGATTSNISALTAGTYSVAVTDANGCSRTETRTISQPGPLVASAVATSAACYGSNTGYIDLTVSGGTTGYTYNWSNGALTQNITGVTAGTYSVLVADAHGCTNTTAATVTEPTNLTASATVTNALCSSCSNGTASLTVSGGTASYTYLWSNGATTRDVTGLTAGTYSVVVTDAHGCTTTQTVVVTAPAPMSVVAAATNVSCAGSSNGSIHLSTSGGTAPYTYAWSNGATTADLSGLAAGSYSVVVTDANGYNATATATISQPAVLTTDAVVTNVLCHGAAGGSINVTVTGGTAPYTYSWSNGATAEDAAGLTADTYYLTVTDAHGCTDNHAYTIAEPSAIVLAGATNNVICGCTEGMGIIYLDVTGGTGDYTYVWSNGATTKNDSALWTGTYSVTVTDGHGCTATGAYAVISPVGLHISSTVANAGCNGGHNGTISLFVTDGVAPYSYSWSTGATTASVSGLGAGVYDVMVTDANGCGIPSTFIITEPSVLAASGTGTTATCGANNGTINLSVSGGTAPYTYNWSNGATTADVTALAAGTYTVEVTDAAGCSVTSITTVDQVLAATPSITGAGNICGGSPATFTATIAGGVWSSSNTAKATVSASGVVSGIAAGTVTITYTITNTCGTYIATQLVTVTMPASSCTLSGTASVCAGATTTFTASIADGVWSSSNASVATVSSTGIVTGAGAGNAVITYTVSNSCGSATATRTVSVLSAPAAIAGTASICAGTTSTFSNAVTGGTWSSSPSSVLSMNAGTGVGTGVTAGTATVTYTLSSGCKATATVTVNALPGNITGALSACIGTSTALGNTVTGGTWASSNTARATIDASGIITGVSTGTSTITYTSAAGCYKTATVTINALPSEITGVKTVCVGGTTALSNATPSGLSWTSSNAGIASVNATGGVVTGVAAGIATITYTLSNGCAITTNVTVNPLPSAISGTLKVCTGATTALGNTDAGGTWAIVNGSVASVNASGVVSGIAAGTSVISYTLATGCVRTGIVTVNAMPGEITGNRIACIGTSTTLGNASGTGSWTSGNTAIATIASVNGVVTGVSAGTVTITYQMGTGCATTAIVTINSAPAANTGSAVVCVGATTTLSNATAGGTWSTSNSAYALVGTATGIVSGSSAGTVTITYSLGTGCRATTTITVNSRPAEITGTASVCAGAATTLNCATTGGVWSSSNTAIATIGSANRIVTGVAAGTATISYTLTANGCARTAVVTVNTVPATGAIDGAATVCSGTTATLTDINAGGTWTSSNTAAATVSTSGVVTGVAAGATTITHTLTNTCGSTTVTKSITVITTPAVAAISGSNTVCAGATIALANATSGGVWSSNNTAVASVSATGVVTGSNSGVAVITYTLTNSCGSSSATAAVTVNAAPTVPAIGGTPVVCMNATTTLTNTIAGGAWSSSNTAVATVAAGGIVSGITAGNAIITYTVSNTCGTTIATQSITVNALPTTAATTGASVVCEGSTITMANATTGGTWSTNNTAVATVNATGVVTGVSAGVVNIIYTVSNGCGNITAPMTVTVNPLPVAGTISGPTNVCIGATIALTSTSPGGLWTSANPLIATTCVCNSGHVTGVAAGNMMMSYTMTNSCGVAYATRPVSVNVVPTVSSSLIVPITAGTTSAPLIFTTTGLATQYSIAWNAAAHTAGFADVTSATLPSSPLPVAVPAAVLAATYTGTLTVSNGYCSSTSKVINLTVDPSVNIYTMAGIGLNGYTGNNGAATAARTAHPPSVATDCNGNTYIADYENAVVRKVDARGVITTVAGTGVVGYGGNGGPATAAQLSNPIAVALDAAGNLYISDYNNSIVRKVNTSGIISTYAGNGGHAYTGDGGAAVSAALNYPNGLYVDAAGNLFIADGYNSVIRKVNTSGVISTIAGTGIVGYTGDGYPAAAARLGHPRNITGDAAGNIYIADYDNEVIRKVNTSGIISTIAGNNIAGYSGDGGPATAAQIWDPYGITVDPSGNVYFSELHSNVIRKVNTAGYISTIAGTGTQGYTGDKGPARQARLFQPMGLSYGCDGNLYVADDANYAVRVIGTYNRKPYFAAGAAQTLMACNTGATVSLNTALAVNDYDTTQAETWTVTGIPAHGTISASYAATSTGSTLTPTGLTYTPAAGYSGTDVFTVTVSDGIATAYTTITVNVSLPPVAGTLTGASSLCGLINTVISATGTGGVWSSSNTAIATVNTGGLVTGTGYGTATISYTVTNGCGVAYATKTITVNPAPVSGTVDGAPSVCLGGTLIYGSTAPGGAWTSGNSAVATVSATGLVTGVALGNTTITYTVTNSCGTSISLRDVFVQQLPVVGTITGTSTICSGSTTVYTNSTPYGAWYSSDPTVVAVDIVSGAVTAMGTGAATLTYSVHNACGVVNVTSGVSVSSASFAVSSITGMNQVCAGATTTLYDATSYGAWSSSDTLVAKVGYNNGIIRGISAGTARITYTVSSPCGSSYTTAIVTVNPLPVAGTITGASSMCQGTSITVYDVIPGGVWSSSNTARATVTASGVVTAIAAGAVSVSYTVTNGCGSASAVAGVPVDPLPVAAAIGGPSVVCVNATITLTDATPFGNWYSGTASVAPIGATGIVTGVTAGTTLITYSAHNGCGYSNITKVITVNPIPVAGTLSGLSSVNVGDNITLLNSGTGGVWSSSNSVLASVGATGVVSGLAPGTVVISYSVTNSCGTASAVKNIDVMMLSAHIIASHVTTAGGHDGCAILVVSGGTAPYTFAWSTGATVQSLAMLTAGTYSVMVTDANGDTASASVVINQPAAGRQSASGNTTGTLANVSTDAFPNPFANYTTIRFTLVEDNFAGLEVYNAATGVKVATLFNDLVKAGEEHAILFNASDLAPGIYLYKIATDKAAYYGKLVIVR